MRAYAIKKKLEIIGAIKSNSPVVKDTCIHFFHFKKYNCMEEYKIQFLNFEFKFIKFFSVIFLTRNIPHSQWWKRKIIALCKTTTIYNIYTNRKKSCMSYLSFCRFRVPEFFDFEINSPIHTIATQIKKVRIYPRLGSSPLPYPLAKNFRKGKSLSLPRAWI